MITPLVKLTLYGRAADKTPALDALQDLGCLHLIPFHAGEEDALEEPSTKARQALRFLQDSPFKREQFSAGPDFDPFAVEEEVLQLQERMLNLEDRVDFLRVRITEVEPWGHFEFAPLEEMNAQRLWFYCVPHNRWPGFEAMAEDLPFQVMHRDNRNRYVVVISAAEPKGLPVERAHIGYISLEELRAELAQTQSDLEDVRAERFKLARWTQAFSGRIAAMEDALAQRRAAVESLDAGPIFAVQAWAPRTRLAEIETAIKNIGLAMVELPTTDEEVPPTLLENAELLAGGEQLVTFYTTPSYREWDPSTVVFLSFTLFFAMILGDAGYALLLGIVLFLVRKKLGRTPAGQRFRRLLTTLVFASLIWGVLVGSYFGVAPKGAGLISNLHLLDVNNFDVMIPLSIGIGILHVIFANLVQIKKYWGRRQAMVPAGWALGLAGGGTCFFAGIAKTPAVNGIGYTLMALGMGLVFLFSSSEKKWWKRTLGGLTGLTRISNAFGDVLSYIRLFALGLASSSLAVSFNGLAKQAADMESGFGFLLGLGILLIGHTLNFALCIMSGVVHGLRLNFIEFFNWSLQEEGRPFLPFSKKEKALWINSSSH